MISGFLTPDSPLRAAFPAGIVPLLSPQRQKVRLGGLPEHHEVYFLAIGECTPEQLKGCALVMSQISKQGGPDQCLAYLSTADAQVPIRAVNFTGVGLVHKEFE